MVNLPLQTNTLNIPRTKEMGHLSLMQQASNFKIDPNALGVKILDSPSISKEIAMSPSSERLIASRRETEGKADQTKSSPYAIENMLNQTLSPTRILSDSRAGTVSVFPVE